MTHPCRVAGVIGGMGPGATIDFMAKVMAYSRAARGPGSTEQEDVRLIVDCNPAVPDRNAAVAGDGLSPGPHLARMARGLERAGAHFLVMPCNAAHAFADHVVESSRLPFVNILTETTRAVRERHPGVRRAGVLAVAATADAQLYERALAPAGIAAITPMGEARLRFMDLVWRIKAGDVGRPIRDAMLACAKDLFARGAELIIAGCTEVPLVMDAASLCEPFVDATAVLAERTVAYARGEPLPVPGRQV